MKKLLFCASITLSLLACNDSHHDNSAEKTPDVASMLDNTLSNDWYVAGDATIKATPDYQVEKGKAKNIILFVGDGMGISTVTAARILAGQLKGMQGEENRLSFGKFPFSGFIKTYNVDAQTPDSAGTMTAIITGVKTDMGVIGVNEKVQRGDCASVNGNTNALVSALELAEMGGKSTGIVSTARITHATPAATYAKSADRNWEDDSELPDSAKDQGCEDIASQLINFKSNLLARVPGADIDGLEVMMGGGRRHFLPHDAAANSTDTIRDIEGRRMDGRNLITEWQALYPEGAYIMDTAGFNQLPSNTPHVLALFNESHMHYEVDRHNDVAGEPSLRDMTKKAIDLLDNNDKGFFLMVEAGRIDHGHHAGSAYTALTETVELAEAVQAAVDATDSEDTLIIVTADHSHVFTIAGYPKRGNPILGKLVSAGTDTLAEDENGMPYTTLGYMNGRGFFNLGDETNADSDKATGYHTGRKDVLFVDTTTPGFHQEALIPLSSETHSGEDVGIYASGPGAALVTGTHEQNSIFHVMNYAGDLLNKAEAALSSTH